MLEPGKQSATYNAAETAKHIDSLPMFFIIGKGRSGTTLLQAMLDSNPNVLIPLESRLIIHLKNKYEHITKWNEKIILDFYNDLFTDVKFNKLWQVNKDKLKHDLLAVTAMANFRLLCKVVYLNYLSLFEKKNITLIGDKNPIYTIFTNDLLRIFPGSRFIHLVRDYRDNIHSHITVFPIKDVPFLARKWKYYNEQAEQLKAHNPESVLTVRYEDLVSDPETQLKKICTFLAIDYDPVMLNYHSGTKKVYDRLGGYIDKYHSNLLNPVNKNKVEGWKTGLSPAHIREAEIITGNYGLKYGYQKQEGKLSSATLQLINQLKLILWLFIVKNYYRVPMWTRVLAGKTFKLLLRNQHKKSQLV